MFNLETIQRVAMDKGLDLKNGKPPYGELEFPPYRTVEGNHWGFMKKDIFQRGMYTPYGDEAMDYWFHYQNEHDVQNVMGEVTRMHREALALHLKYAKGHVVVCGLDHGLLPYNLCTGEETGSYQQILGLQ